MKNDLLGTIGRTLPIKQAFAGHFLRGIDEIVPVTDEMVKWLSRPRESLALVCADRMIDDVEKLLKKYHDTSKGSSNGIHAPFPVILVAFGKDAPPIAADRNRLLPNPQLVQLAEHGEYYKMRCDFIEQRVQIAFFAHTSETAKAMTSQMRLYFARFRNFHFPIKWQFGGYDFELIGNITEMPASDELADLSDRTNLTILTWTLVIECQVPYLTAPTPHELTDDGNYLKGYKALNRVDFDVNGRNHDDLTVGIVDDTPQQLIHGEWV